MLAGSVPRITKVMLGVVFLSYAMGGCSSKDVAARVETILRLSAEGRYLEIVDDLEGVKWTQDSDPELLILYCSARFALNPQNSSCVLRKESEKEIHAFAHALWQVWSGHTSEAKTTFETLYKSEIWLHWGAIGKLLLAQYTENYRRLGELLHSFGTSALRKKKYFERIFKKYQLLYAQETLDWDGLNDYLKQYKFRQIERDPVLFSAQSQLYFARGMSKELGRLLNKTKHTLGETTAYKFRMADFFVMQDNISKSKEVIISSALLDPENVALQVERAYIDILSASRRTSEAAWRRLYKIAYLSRYNVKLLLHMAVTLSSYHRLQESIEIFDLIDIRGTTLTDFTIFHILSAWGAIYRGKINKAGFILQEAIDMAPTHVEGNWLKVLIAKKRNDPNKAAEALEVLFSVDPYNKDYRKMIRYFWNKFQTKELGMLYEKINNWEDAAVSVQAGRENKGAPAQ